MRPLARDGHTAVWTGSEMIVWGGDNGSGVFEHWRAILRATGQRPTPTPTATPTATATATATAIRDASFIADSDGNSDADGYTNLYTKVYALAEVKPTLRARRTPAPGHDSDLHLRTNKLSLCSFGKIPFHPRTIPMKKSNPTIKAQILRSAFYVLLRSGRLRDAFGTRADAASMAGQHRRRHRSGPQRTLTSQSGCAYQRAIEEVYGGTGIWPSKMRGSRNRRSMR